MWGDASGNTMICPLVVLPTRGTIAGWINGPMATSCSRRGKAMPCIWGRITPGSAAHRGLTCCKAAWQRGPWVPQFSSFIPASNMPWHQGRSVASWAIKTVASRSRKTILHYSAAGETTSRALYPVLGFPIQEIHGLNSLKGHRNRSTWSMRKDRESWDCLAWRGEGSRRILSMCINGQKIPFKPGGKMCDLSGTGTYGSQRL